MKQDMQVYTRHANLHQTCKLKSPPAALALVQKLGHMAFSIGTCVGECWLRPVCSIFVFQRSLLIKQKVNASWCRRSVRFVFGTHVTTTSVFFQMHTQEQVLVLTACLSLLDLPTNYSGAWPTTTLCCVPTYPLLLDHSRSLSELLGLPSNQGGGLTKTQPPPGSMLL